MGALGVSGYARGRTYLMRSEPPHPPHLPLRFQSIGTVEPLVYQSRYVIWETAPGPHPGRHRAGWNSRPEYAASREEH